jgi:hypothetical protein
MSLHSKIAAFLGSRSALPYCDDCISAELGGDHLGEVCHQTKNMREQFYFLNGGRGCVQCGERKVTTLARSL